MSLYYKYKMLWSLLTFKKAKEKSNSTYADIRKDLEFLDVGMVEENFSRLKDRKFFVGYANIAAFNKDLSAFTRFVETDNLNVFSKAPSDNSLIEMYVGEFFIDQRGYYIPLVESLLRLKETVTVFLNLLEDLEKKGDNYAVRQSSRLYRDVKSVLQALKY